MKARILFFTVLTILLSNTVHAAQSDPWSGFGTTPERARLASVMEKSLSAYASVNDYQAVFHKQERSGGTLGPDETIFLKFEKPFKIFMSWMDTRKKGLQVLYERGKHDGKLAIHQPGLLLGLAPVIFLEPNSPWVKEGSESYDIEDAGIGSFLDDFAAALLKGAAENKLAVTGTTEALGDTADVTFKGSLENDGYFAYRVRVHFNRTNALPDRMELFDWQGRPMGVYVYDDLKLNIGAKDDEFQKIAHRKLIRLYDPPLKTQTGTNFASKS